MQEDSIDLSRLLFILWRKKKVVLILIAVCTVLAGTVASVLPKEYTSRVMVQIVHSNMLTDAVVTTNVANDVELLRSNEVLLPIIEQVFNDVSQEKKPDAEGFAKKYLDIKNVRGTQLVKISAKGRTPQEAKYIADNVAANFVEIKKVSYIMKLDT